MGISSRALCLSAKPDRSEPHAPVLAFSRIVAISLPAIRESAPVRKGRRSFLASQATQPRKPGSTRASALCSSGRCCADGPAAVSCNLSVVRGSVCAER